MRNLYGLVPTLPWVLFRRARYLYEYAVGSNRIAGERIRLPWDRDFQIVRAIKRVIRTPPFPITKTAECELWETPLGRFWTPLDASVSYMSMLSIEALADVYQLAAQGRNDHQIVIDCGANIGVFARMALNFGAARVICCEPSPRTRQCLALTFEAEIRAERVSLVADAVWDQVGTVQFSTMDTSNPGSHHIVTDTESDSISVSTTTIDSIVRKLALPHVDFIKMDIEGAEARALEGAALTIQRFHPLVGVATEHTGDIAANNAEVIEVVRRIDSTYKVRCTEVHTERSASLGRVLSPYSLFFYRPRPSRSAAAPGSGEVPVKKKIEVVS